MIPRVGAGGIASVAIIGCGNIGFRHLQALTAGSEPAEVTVVEPNPATHERIREHFAGAATSGKTFELVSALPESPQAFDLAVVATTTDTRRAAVDALLDRHDVRVLILEKVLFPRIADLTAVGDQLAERGVTAFVNCARRTWPGYAALRQDVSGGIVRRIDVGGNRFGLASNAVHLLDLAEYLTGAGITTISADGLDPGYVPSKRPGAVEIFGTLSANLSDATALTITCHDKEDPLSVEVVVETDTGRVVIDELARTMTVEDQAREFAMQTVSETTWIYDDALRTQTCSLTPYADSARQHRALLNAVRPHLGLSNAADDPCPIS
jgi:predicted dehydrogenase